MADETWLKNVGAVQIGQSYTSHKQMVADMIKNYHDHAGDDLTSAEGWSAFEDFTNKIPKAFQEAHGSDTSMGGCDVLNPYYQFCRFDDIVHPMLSNGVNDEGYGSIYSEMIADKQKILWLSFGTPRFKGMNDFLNIGSNDSLRKSMVDGRTNIPGTIGHILGTTGFVLLKWTAFFPLAAISTVLEFGQKIVRSTLISRYFDFRESMLQYYKFVNYLLIAMSSHLGFRLNAGNLTEQGAAQHYMDRIAEDEDDPEVLKLSADVFAMLTKRYRRKNSSLKTKLEEKSLDAMYDEDTYVNDDYDTYFQKVLRNLEGTSQYQENSDDHGGFGDGFAGALRGSNRFIGFRIEKSTSMDESFDNQTAPPTILNTLNSMATEARNRSYNLMGGKMGGDGILGALGFVVGGAADMATSALSAMTGNLSTAATSISSGNGKFDIPEMWTDSSFTKSYNFDIKLRARYGNPYSVFMDLYTPYSFILAGMLPRAIGNNMYTSPFLCQAYVRGFFSTTLGIFSNLNVQRGSDEFGWSNEELPLCLQLRLSIKDLSPAMFMSMRSAVQDLLNMDTLHNVGMEDYLATLGGMSLSSRTARLHQLFRNKGIAVTRIKNTVFNPRFLGMWVGDNLGPLKAIVHLTPWRDFPERNSSRQL